jgi:hypothetical protein
MINGRLKSPGKVIWIPQRIKDDQRAAQVTWQSYLDSTAWQELFACFCRIEKSPNVGNRPTRHV